MPVYAYCILAAGWLAWCAPFFLIKRGPEAPVKKDRRARWGIVLEAVAYWLLWRNVVWAPEPPNWRVACSIVFFLLASLLSSTATRALGRQWNFDASLNADHELVRSGPYRLVRHPIYASMLCTLLGTGLMVAPPLTFVVATVIFLAGAEIRVRVEDALLASRFGDQMREYQRSVPAYIPFVR